ncbi:hypothetical protein ACN27G_15255 [Plantactinospora sp. WMMB334]|uniref:hypothetical protein n=1 Tax=Plantactinospora sp. WMMB334 TaxID=3404119 RepID=UPI003B9586A4
MTSTTAGKIVAGDCYIVSAFAYRSRKTEVCCRAEHVGSGAGGPPAAVDHGAVRTGRAL